MIVQVMPYPGGATGDTVPTFSNVVLLSGFGGTNGSTTFTDESSYARAMTAAGNAQISTAQSKFGGSSGAFDGTGDWVTMASASQFNFGYNAFTIDCFVRLNSTAAAQGLVTKYRGLGSNIAWYLSVVSGGAPRFAVSNGVAPTASATTSGIYITSSASLSTGQWYHVRAERTAADAGTGGSIMRLYVDGVMVAKTATAGSGTGSNVNVGGTTTAQVWLGGLNNNSGEWPLNGYLDEVRVVNGQALCASDSGFMVPTSAYPRS